MAVLTVALIVVVMSLLASDIASADGYRGGGGHYGGGGGYYRGGGGHYGGWGGGWGHRGSNFRFGLSIGVPFWGYYPGPYYYPYYAPYYNPYYYPYYSPYYYPPAVTVPSTPQSYIERNQPQESSAPPAIWFYCPDSKKYYPYVRECPGGWETVPAEPPPGTAR
ncbi:MAG: hypothetical protein ACM3ON_01035 [Chloroflexota bacterium]